MVNFCVGGVGNEISLPTLPTQKKINHINHFVCLFLSFFFFFKPFTVSDEYVKHDTSGYRHHYVIYIVELRIWQKVIIKACSVEDRGVFSF